MTEQRKKKLTLKRVDKGLSFDAEAEVPFHSTSRLTFMVLTTFVTNRPRVQAAIPSHVQMKLYAYQQQALFGPNKTNRPGSDPLTSFFNVFGVTPANDPELVKWYLKFACY